MIRGNLLWLEIRRNSRNEILLWRLRFSRKLHLLPTQLETSQVPVYLISFWTRSFEASTSAMSSFRVEVVWEVGYDPVSKISVSYVFYRPGIWQFFELPAKQIRRTETRLNHRPETRVIDVVYLNAIVKEISTSNVLAFLFFLFPFILHLEKYFQRRTLFCYL